ncbi:hypothetical protein Aca07nite_08320 [Actinoplanes capillaceus]|uniref:Uncharacterized protein n=1 Tax=Actinoplanes campanulatus TaxID=113559 RepID=A0ABQ3W923_9ACTN|nr:hypothetical protein Aca07nite_08320 [Actinoplanes capillaceus]
MWPLWACPLDLAPDVACRMTHSNQTREGWGGVEYRCAGRAFFSAACRFARSDLVRFATVSGGKSFKITQCRYAKRGETGAMLPVKASFPPSAADGTAIRRFARPGA